MKKFLWRLLMVLIVISLLRIFSFDSYQIESPSMESELLTGDKVFVNKLAYGARIPNVIKIPFLSEDMDYVRVFHIPLHFQFNFLENAIRTKGFSKIQHNDVVAFNLPIDNKFSIELKNLYIKRCVGLPGDVVSIKSGNLFVNNLQETPKSTYRHNYVAYSHNVLNSDVLRSFNINNIRQIPGTLKLPKVKYVYDISTDTSTINLLCQKKIIDSCTRKLSEKSFANLDIFPYSPKIRWNKDFFGPLQIPYKGMNLQLDKSNILLYYNTLKFYENVKGLQYFNGQIYRSGKPLTKYVFTKDYYFMMGDNRDNSFDSRYWGFVPEDHIVGKASVTWFATGLFNDNKSFFKRTFHSIN